MLRMVICNMNCVMCMFRCGHCMKFAPEFEEASEILKTVAPSVALLEVSTR